MNPGATTRPRDVEDALDLGRIDRAEVADGEDPVAEHADIGAPAGAPVPSMTVPPRSSRSKPVTADDDTAAGPSGRGRPPDEPASSRAGAGPSCYTPPSVGL